MKIRLPKYETVEVKEFPLEPDYSGDPIFEQEEFEDAATQREKDISAYLCEKASKKWIEIDYPDRTNFRSDNSGGRIFLRISRGYYAPDNSQRILILGEKYSPLVYVVFQKATEPTSEQKKIK